MTAQQARVLKQALASMLRSVNLMQVAERACANAGMVRHATAQRRRRAFVLHISGGADPDGGVPAAEAVKKKLVGGLLPRFPAAKIEYTHGEQITCVACEKRIGWDQIKVDAHFDLVLVGARVTLPFHLECFDTWQTETRAAIA